VDLTARESVEASDVGELRHGTSLLHHNHSAVELARAGAPQWLKAPTVGGRCADATPGGARRHPDHAARGVERGMWRRRSAPPRGGPATADGRSHQHYAVALLGRAWPPG